MEQLERAIQVWEQWNAAGRPISSADLLRQHQDLAELLQAMLADRDEVERAIAADDGSQRTLGDFRLLRELGRGGMGVVHEAWQRSLQRKVAIKVLAPALVGSPSAVARFRREAAAAARLRHPAIVEVYGFGEDEGTCWFAMQRIDGVPLHECLAGFAVPSAAIALAIQIVAALDHAHRAGLVHRDVKPGNVLVRADGSAVLTDFGLASDEQQPSLTVTGGFLGTLDYAAPEQIRGQRVDARADLWAVGVMLHELLAGRHPFRGSTREATMRAILGDDPPPLIGRPGISRDLAAVVQRALAKEPDRRYGDAAALLADLQALAAGAPVSARLDSPLQRLARWTRRQPWRASALAALVAGAAVATVGFVLASRRADDNAILARTNGELALAATAAKERLAAKVQEFDLLAGVTLYQRAVVREQALYPAWPHQLEAMRTWLREDCARLEALQPQVQAAIAALRQRARPADEPGRWTFAEEAPQFLHDTLTVLLADLDRLFADQKVRVQQRIAWAERIGSLSRAHPNARVGWPQARAAIATADGVAASTAYRGVDIPLADDVVLGLVPIGCNPVTRLWEFYDLRSAWDGKVDPATLPIPAHAADGSIAVDEHTGIVFVLLPGGDCAMGAQATDPLAPNYDPDAQGWMGPVQQVPLWPFLIARHETTQAQWARLWAGDEALRFPSGNAAGTNNWVGGTITWHNPVEKVSWTMATTLLWQHGMVLPTEVQWEYACRGGTTTPWWCGEECGDLAGCANVNDASGHRSTPGWGEAEAFDDGHVVHAPVGSFRPNPFGLYDMHGNVAELCRDASSINSRPFRPGDGARTDPDRPDDRSQRGGQFTKFGLHARCAIWGYAPPDLRAFDLGVRPVRQLRQP